MKITIETVEQYLEQIAEDKKEGVNQLRKTIMENLPEGFQETISYGMIGYVVPHSIYPSGYHCNPKLPLPFISLAAQKNAISFSHMGIYALPELLDWWVQEYPKHSTKKLDMGKSCIRFKKTEEIPLGLVAELCRKMTPQDWISTYESCFKKK